VQDGKRIVTLHVNFEESVDYTPLRDRLVRLVQQRLHDSDAMQA
jgi:hypothetical protein